MKAKIGIVVSDFNKEITSKMEKTAEILAGTLGMEIVKKIHVPGAFEIPFAVKNILEKEKVDSIVTLGAVIQGGTDHDIVIVQNTVRKLADLALAYNKPVGLGIIGPRVSWEKAEERAEEYAERSVRTVVEMVKKLG